MTVTSFPKEVSLQSKLRPYQERVLSGLTDTLDDNCLHVVAAPGSGKTVLGLEAVFRIGKPALILSPTLAIRNQWIDRFQSLFLPPEEERPSWISTDARKPSLLTVLTYQALHCACTGESYCEDGEEESGDAEPAGDEDEPASAGRGDEGIDVAALLRDVPIGTIVLDEAHHLRSSWWKTLANVRDKLGHPTMVALTATPPYDVSLFEWERYKNLCGPVDAEISVPELVLDGTLCPHQDYIYFNRPSREEHAVIHQYNRDVDQFCEDLRANSDFLSAVLSHPWITDTDAHIEDILSSPAYFSGMLIFIKSVMRDLPKRLPGILGHSTRDVPALTTEWLEILLNGCIYSDRASYLQHESTMAAVEYQLKHIGAVERRQIKLKCTDRINKLLASSINKLESILEISMLESGALKDDLRLLILTDYIRRSALPRSPGDIRPLNQIGVTTIFEKLRLSLPAGTKLGAVSGSMVIVPTSARPFLEEQCRDLDIPLQDISIAPLNYDSAFSFVELRGSNRERTIRLITRVFSAGGINILVGTKSLLGEGWDAPCINSLVLASFVGSYMLSNQMRGRAIRSQSGNPQKTANIWHLVCVQTEKDGDPGEDYHMLKRRFKAFVGPGMNSSVIENGIARLGIGKPPFKDGRIDDINRLMCSLAVDRPRLHEAWKSALAAGGTNARIVEEVNTPAVRLPRRFVFQNTLEAMVRTGLCAGLYVWSELTHMRIRVSDSGDYLKYIAIFFAISTAVTLPWLIKALWLFIKHGPVESSMRQIGQALLESMLKTGIIKTPSEKSAVMASRDSYGFVTCSLSNATAQETALFLDALQELVGPIENQRYILVRRSTFLNFGRIDYHAVPAVLGINKESAEIFAAAWQARVGPMSLVYTRTAEGRKILLKARQSAMSASFQKKSTRTSKWK